MGVLKKWLIVLTAVALCCLIAWTGRIGYLNSYVPYVPINFIPDQGFLEKPQINTPKHQQNVKEVLGKQFHIKWKFQNGKVMIQRKMMIGDDNLNDLWNLTLQADHKEYRTKVRVIDRAEYERLTKELKK